jgi:hypothetical protein
MYFMSSPGSVVAGNCLREAVGFDAQLGTVDVHEHGRTVVAAGVVKT